MLSSVVFYKNNYKERGLPIKKKTGIEESTPVFLIFRLLAFLY